ncbi:MAG: NUDIX domain-containing protein [Spirochaetaceae bacterium]|nr:NUDIX domain-containing protein [Spirochaetaceae bacterium]
MMNESIACIISSGSKVLLGKRLPSGSMGNRWEFPGGKVEPDETHEQAIIRELKEEFGTSCSVGQKITSTSFENNSKKYNLYAYDVKIDLDISELVLTEHSQVEWKEITDIPSLEFVDSDNKIYPEVKKYILGNVNA